MQLQSIHDVKAFQKPCDSILATLFTRKLSRVTTFYLLRFIPNITPNIVSLISFLLAIIACGLFISPSYGLRIIGVILLQLSFVFDCSDGEIARIRNLSSPFGAWLDSILDRFKEALMFGALTTQWYWFHDGRSMTIVVGACAAVGMLLVTYLREAKKSSWSATRKSEFSLTRSMYVGTVDLMTYVVSVGVMFQYENMVLWFFALLSFPMLVMQIRSAYRQSFSG